MKIVADLHIHTVASGHAYSTIKENLIAAREAGLEMIAITDHGPSLPGAPCLSYFSYLQILPEEDEGVEILAGAEANILEDGVIDLPDRYLNLLDIVLAGFHPPSWKGGSQAENTKAMINAIKNPYVDIIVHPGNPQYPIDIDAVIEAALEYDTILEINNNSLTEGVRKGSREVCSLIARECAEKNVTVALGSDAHYVDRVGKLDLAVELALEAGIKEEQIFNTSTEKIKTYLRGKGKLDRRY
jgi:putative hydrolase